MKGPLRLCAEPRRNATLTLSHDDGAHEDLDGPDSLEGNLALASSLVEAKLVAELILRDGIGVIDLVAEDDKGNLGELLHGE